MLMPRLIGLCVVLAMLAFSHFTAYRLGKGAVNALWTAEKLEQAQAAEKIEQAQQESANQASDTYEKARSNEQDTIKQLRAQVDALTARPTYHVQCIDDDGLRVLDAAIDGAPAGDTGKPSAGMPGIKPPSGRNGGINPPVVNGYSLGVQRLPGEAQGAR